MDDSTNHPAKKRKAASDQPRPGNDDPSNVLLLSANLSLADLNMLIDQRVDDAVGAKTLALTSRVDSLQRENEGLLLKCESLERSVQALKKEGNWSYSAPDVPRSHWIDQGHDEEYADSADSAIQSIKDVTHDLREGGAGNKTVVGGSEESPIPINLSNNHIKTNGDTCIPDFLSANPPLEELLFWGNQLTDDDAIQIGLALQSNTNLRCLDLDQNKLTKKGKRDMHLLSIYGLSRSDLPALKVVGDLNLNSVSGANHTCHIDGISKSATIMNRENMSGANNSSCDIHGIVGCFMNDGKKSAKWNRGQKLFELLGKRHNTGCNISHLESEFSEVGMGLVPHVLACINTRATDFESKFNLSLLFELTRDWKTPELFR